MISPTVLKAAIAIALGSHAVAHALALAATFTTAGAARGSRLPLSSWLLAGPPAPGTALAASLIWGVATFAFLTATLSYLGVLVPAGAWRQLAVFGAVISLAGMLFLGMWPGSVSAGNSLLNLFCALVMNAAILVTQLGLHWPQTPLLAN